MIFLAQRWNRQPPCAYELDLRHPLLRGAAVFVDLRAPRIGVNLVTGRTSGYTAVGTGPRFTSQGIRTTGDASNFCHIAPGINPVSAPVSVVWSSRFFTGSPAILWSVLENTPTWNGLYGTNASIFSFSAGSGDGAVGPTLVRSHPTNAVYAASTYVGANNLRTCGGGAVAVDTSCTAIASGGGSFARCAFGVAYRDIADSPGVAEAAYWGSFTRRLSDEELREWSLRPWQVVRKQQRRLYFGVPVTGGSFLPSWARVRSVVIGAGVGL